MMKHYSYRIMQLIVILVLTNSCMHFGRLTRRYAAMEEVDLNTKLNSEVEVYGFVQKVDKPPKIRFTPKTVFDLAPQGQSQLIKILGAKNTSSDDFVKSLKSSLTAKPEDEQTKFVDLTTFSRTIILTVKKTSIRDQDRVTRVDIGLTPDNKDVQFIGCDKIVTSYATADLGNLKFSENRSAELNGNLGGSVTLGTSNQNVTGANNSTGVTTGNGTNDVNGTTFSNGINGNSTSNTATTGSSNVINNATNSSTTTGTTNQTAFNSGVSGKLTAGQNFSEEVNLRQRYVSVSAYMKKKELHFYQEGISGIDVSGNIIASVNLEFAGNITEATSFTFEGLYDNSGAPNDPGKLVGSQVVYSYPSLSSDVQLAISYEGIVRKVTKNGKTISEADDHIQLEHGTGSNEDSMVLLKKDDITPMQWYILDPASNTLDISGPPGSGEFYSGPLYFDSYENGMQFLQWMKANFTKIKNAAFKVGSGAKVYTLKRSGGGTFDAGWVASTRLQINR